MRTSGPSPFRDRSGGKAPARPKTGRNARGGSVGASDAAGIWAGPERRLLSRCWSCRAGEGRVEGGGREGGRAGPAKGAVGLAGTLRPGSTDSGRAVGRPRRPAQARSQQASEAAPRGKSQGLVPSVSPEGQSVFSGLPARPGPGGPADPGGPAPAPSPSRTPAACPALAPYPHPGLPGGRTRCQQLGPWVCGPPPTGVGAWYGSL